MATESMPITHKMHKYPMIFLMINTIGFFGARYTILITYFDVECSSDCLTESLADCLYELLCDALDVNLADPFVKLGSFK